MEWLNLAVGIIGIVVTLALAFGGFFLKHLNDKFSDHVKRLDKAEESLHSLPDVYARRDDVKDMKNEILSGLRDLSNKVESLRSTHNG